MSASIRYLVSATATAVLLLLGCSREQTAPPATPRVADLAPTDQPAAEDTFKASLPEISGPSGYTGSAACRSCHEDQHASWHRSFHRTMTQVATEESVQAAFDNVVLNTDTTRFTLNKRQGEFWVRMEPLVMPSAESGPQPVLEQRLSLVTGSHHMQVFWVPEGDGNLQLGFPFTWLIPERRWVPRNSTFVRPPDLQHHAEVWNVVCSRCHTTGVRPRVDFSARTAETQVAELGIACEACHGPGERHVQKQKSEAGSQKGVEPGEIIQPKKLPAARSAQVCGFCHSMKWMDRSNDWREHGFQFRPGDDLELTTPVIRPSRVDSIAGLREYLARNPEVLRDFFWPDGMMRVSGREYNGLIESPCYQGGQFSCVSCHSLHESEPDDQLSTKAKGNGACAQCHQKFQDSKAVAAHSHHGPESSGSMCYNCHMPHTTYGILSAIRSHQISSPKVADDLASGRPNACNLCHLDKTIAWTGTRLTEWYGQKSTDLNAGNSSTSHIITLALSGDAGQRVLAAWALGWSTATETSNTNWVAPVLAQLLDDPYAAVRCVAERSFRARFGQVPSGYDYTIDPANRQSWREIVWDAWEQQSAGVRKEKEATVLIENGRIQREAYEQLLRRRNNRPVRLRE